MKKLKRNIPKIFKMLALLVIIFSLSLISKIDNEKSMITSSRVSKQ